MHARPPNDPRVEGAWLLSASLKIAFGVARPGAPRTWYEITGYGFPSAHALVTLVGCGWLAWALRRTVSYRVRATAYVGAAIVAALAGVARVVLNAHWLSDVLAGFAIGVVWLNVVLLVAVSPERPAPGRSGSVRWMAPVLALGMALAAGLTVPVRGIGQPAQVISVFYVVNQSGRDVRLRVLADDREVLALDLPAAAPAPGSARVMPPPGPHPARELKVALPAATEWLEAQEVRSGLTRRVDVRDFATRGLGFRIIIGASEILIAQDYYPIRRGP